MRPSVLLTAGLLTLFGCVNGATEPQLVNKPTMPDTQLAWPFGLTPETLSDVELSYGFQSSKTGAGQQDIVIRGDGHVRLFFSRSMYDEEPQVREGQLPQEVILRLLEVVEEQDFFYLEDHYPPEGPSRGGWIIHVALPDSSKRVAVEGTHPPAFERAAGAIKLAAGLALPEALRGRLFPIL